MTVEIICSWNMTLAHWWQFADILEEYTASVFWVESNTFQCRAYKSSMPFWSAVWSLYFCPRDRGSIFFWHVKCYTLNGVTLHMAVIFILSCILWCENVILNCLKPKEGWIITECWDWYAVPTHEIGNDWSDCYIKVSQTDSEWLTD